MMFKDHDNKLSSKRIIGAVILFICVSMALLDMFTNYLANEFIFGTMFGGGIALLGVETIFRNGKRKHTSDKRDQ